MNFTEKIRKNILKNTPEIRSECLAMLAAFLDTSGYSHFSGYLTSGEFSFSNENEEVAEYFLMLVDKLFGVSMTVTEVKHDPKHGRGKLTFSYSGENAGEYADEISDYSAVNLTDENEMRAYLKGAFLGSGSCTLPNGTAKTGYHLEFVFPYEDDAVSFCEMLDKLQLLANIIPRAEKYVVYCKNRDAISDFLSVVGADSALKELEKLLIAREENNFINRVENCMAGNADKSMTASAEQAHRIQKLKGSAAFSNLPEALKELCEERLNNPTLSLRELAVKLGVSKSCLNHRMRKLMEICKRGEEGL